MKKKSKPPARRKGGKTTPLQPVQSEVEAYDFIRRQLRNLS